MQMVIRRAGGVVLLGALLAACGGSNGGNGNNPVVTIAKTSGGSGDAQTATVATALPTQLSVTVTEDGAVKAGATVTWSAGASSGSVAPTSMVTDANGVATTTWTLGNGAGGQTAQATLAGAGGSPLGFTATGTAGAASAFTKSAGDAQTVFPSTAFGTPLAVLIADQFGNGISGVTVNWAVQSGSATVASATSVTNASGVATIGVTAGATPGAAVVRATNASVVGTLDFGLTVTAFPNSAGVTAAFISYTSNQNATSDPAVDTIGVGGTVSWSGLGTNNEHFVRSTGIPTFTTQTVSAATYQFTFNTVGTYTYDCTIHTSGMTGRVVVR